MLPTAVIEKPYELSFMAVFDADGNLIWNEHSKIDDETFEKAITESKEVYAHDHTGTHDQDTELLVKLDDGIQFYSKNISSPVANITKHSNYKEEYRMFVVCGQQRVELLEMFQSNLTKIIETDLSYFSFFLLIVNILIFISFTLFFEHLLQRRVVKPIVKLTKQIKNPKEFGQ